MRQRYIMLFQYGSNMDPDRLNSAERLNGVAEIVGVAKLRGWGVRFDLYSRSNGCAVTDIVPNKKEHTQGVLYKVPYRSVVAPRGERSRMDYIEGAKLGDRSNYRQRKIKVIIEGELVNCRTYLGTAGARKRFQKLTREDKRVSDVYFGYLLAGARRFKFSKPYIAYLQKQARRPSRA